MNTHTKQYILHVDGDSFFASCEIARLPHLKGKPVVVGEDRGIACAMSKEAKALGITRGMPIFKIRDQFPEVIILPSHFELYEQYAHNLFSILTPYLDILERYSIDECFGLVTFPIRASESHIRAWLAKLKQTVQVQTGITYSFGLARTKVLAKIASKYKKPDGCTAIFEADEKTVLRSVPIESLWGIGWGLSRRFRALRIKTAYEFSTWDSARVQRTFALPVQELWYELCGTRVFSVADAPRQPKSLQSTKSFTATNETPFVTAELLQNLDIVFSRMRQYGLVTKSISFYIKTPERRYVSDVLALPYYSDNPLDAADKLAALAQKLYKPHMRYRATGVTVWALRPKDSITYDFFGYQKAVTENAVIARTVDSIREQFGYRSVSILGALPSTSDRREKAAAKAQRDSFLSGLPLPYLGEVS